MDRAVYINSIQNKRYFILYYQISIITQNIFDYLEKIKVSPLIYNLIQS